MRQLANYGDIRQVAVCAYCCGATKTRDHVPARVLLDEPFPENLAIVPACLDCNNAASVDEEYLACLVECVICGTTEPHALQRAKVRRLLAERPRLQARLAAAHRQEDAQSVFSVELERVEYIVAKLARGHSLYELNEPMIAVPSSIWIAPLHLLGDQAREAFESTAGHSFATWPEIGSRAMQRWVESGQKWIEVQSGRYRYLATADVVVRVRLVLSEYLACEVRWDE